MPRYIVPAGTDLDVARVWKTEEKGSDVNLGVHLVRDAFLDRFDEAAVLTNDTDLTEAVRIVTSDAGKAVTLLAPNSRPSASLVAAANHVRHVQPYLGPCQLPPTVTAANGKVVTKPAAW